MNMRNPILDSATEDFTGLWEILWRGRTLMPDVSEQEIRSCAQEDLRTMIVEGLILVYRGTRFAGEESPLPAKDALDLLILERSWEAPDPGAEHLRIVATEAGAKVYYTSE